MKLMTLQNLDGNNKSNDREYIHLYFNSANRALWFALGCRYRVEQLRWTHLIYFLPEIRNIIIMYEEIYSIKCLFIWYETQENMLCALPNPIAVEIYNFLSSKNKNSSSCLYSNNWKLKFQTIQKN